MTNLYTPVTFQQVTQPLAKEMCRDLHQSKFADL